jgi:hypothetical protein
MSRQARDADLSRKRLKGRPFSMRAGSPFRPRLGHALVLLAAVACASCSGSGGAALNPVRGKILDGKGQPLAGAVVTFHPKSLSKSANVMTSVGRAGADGEFTLATGDKNGAPAGEYVVTVIWPEEPKQDGKISMAPPENRDRLNGAFANRDSTKLRAEVKAGPNQLDPIRLPK